MGLRNGEVAGRWQRSKALAGIMIAAQRDKPGLGEEGDRQGKTSPAGQAAKSTRTRGRVHGTGTAGRKSSQNRKKEGKERPAPAGVVHAGYR